MEHLSPIMQNQLKRDGLCFSCREALRPYDQNKKDNLCQPCRNEHEILNLIAEITQLKKLNDYVTKRLDAVFEETVEVIKEKDKKKGASGDKG